MPTSGLVISARQADDVPAILEALQDEPAVEAGVPIGRRIPAVVDTPDKDRDKHLWQWLGGLPGVASVDVAFIAFEE